MVYFYIGTTLTKSNENETLQDLNARAFRTGFGNSVQATAELFTHQIPNLKLGNLDSLMFISEQMIKQETSLEGFLKKIERQIEDIDNQEKIVFTIDTKDGQVPIDKYIHTFTWDQNKFVGQTPTDILNSLRQRQEILDKEIRSKTSAFNDAKNNFNSLQKREGNLFVRDLSDVLTSKIVKPKDFVNTPNLGTVVAVISNEDEEKFLELYESFTDYVVPNSAKKFDIEESEGISLWRVIIFKKNFEKFNEAAEEQAQKKPKKAPIEEFIQVARDKHRFVIREFDYNPQEVERKDRQRGEMEHLTKKNQGLLLAACKNGYQEAYTIYIHLKRLRYVVDIAMRFGVHERVTSILVKPQEGKEKKVLQDLLQVFVEPNQKGLYGTKEDLDEQEDFFPFVYIPINIV